MFTKLNLKTAFNLLRVAPADEWKMAFHANEGLFEYLVMPFGLTKAPAAFQSFIQWVLHKFLGIFCVAYLDDILIFLCTQDDHDYHVLQILSSLDWNRLLASVDKCEFDKNSLKYLGFILGKNRISMHPKKLSTISDWPPPCSVKEVQHFLGFANFYHQFISHYALISSPLYVLTQKDSPTPFSLTINAWNAFKSLKKSYLPLFSFIITWPNPYSFTLILLILLFQGSHTRWMRMVPSILSASSHENYLLQKSITTSMIRRCWEWLSP